MDGDLDWDCFPLSTIDNWVCVEFNDAWLLWLWLFESAFDGAFGGRSNGACEVGLSSLGVGWCF